MNWKMVLVSFVLCFAVTTALPAPEDVIWTKVTNLNSEDDHVVGLAESADHQHMYQCVSTHVSGIVEYSPYIAKFTTAGDSVWAREYTEFVEMIPCGIVALSTGGFVFAIADNSGLELQYRLIRCDDDGEIVEQTTYTVGSSHFHANAELFSCDGGYALAGVTEYGSNTHVFLARFSETGELDWSYSSDHSGYSEWIKASWSDAADSFFLTTSVEPNGGLSNVLFFRINADGEEEWCTNTYPFNYCTIGGIVQIPDSSTLFAGVVESGANNLLWICELDPETGEVLNNIYDDELRFPFVNDVFLNLQGHAILAGSCRSDASKKISLAIELANDFSYEWLATYEETGHTEFRCGLQHSNGFLFMGGSHSNIDYDCYAACLKGSFQNSIPEMILTTEAQPLHIPPEGGTVTYDISLSSVNSGEFYGWLWRELRLPDLYLTDPFSSLAIAVGADETISIENQQFTLNASSPAGEYILYVQLGDAVGETAFSDAITIIKDTVSDVSENHDNLIPEQNSIHSIYPNPFNEQASIQINLAQPGNVEITLFDIMGREVAKTVSGIHPAGRHTIPLTCTGLVSGVYLVQAHFPDGSSQLRKAVLVK